MSGFLNLGYDSLKKEVSNWLRVYSIYHKRLESIDLSESIYFQDENLREIQDQKKRSRSTFALRFLFVSWCNLNKEFISLNN